MEKYSKELKIARGMFGINAFPGNLFSFITNQDDYIDRYKMVIFREDLDKLQGFIAYEGDFAYIGINHKRPIGLQNFTLAHELGHYFLHKGRVFSDSNVDNPSAKQGEEAEAFDFGMSLLYPEQNFIKDNEYINKESLLAPSNSKSLGLFINELSHKYYLSFPVVLHRHLYKHYLADKKSLIINSINKALGENYTHLDPDFYISNDSSYNASSKEPYLYLEKVVAEAIERRAISPATGESILFPYSNKGGAGI